MIVAMRSGVRAHEADIGNSAHSTAPTIRTKSTRSISHKRYALVSETQRLLSAPYIVFRTGVTDVAVLVPDDVAEGRGEVVLVDGVVGTCGVAGFTTGTEGLDDVGEITCTGPDPTLVETTPKHTGCPVRAESRVTCMGNVPLMGVVSMSACI